MIIIAIIVAGFIAGYYLGRSDARLQQEEDDAFRRLDAFIERLMSKGPRA